MLCNCGIWVTASIAEWDKDGVKHFIHCIFKLDTEPSLMRCVYVHACGFILCVSACI